MNPTIGTNGTPPASGHQSMIDRGIALAQALSTAQDTPLNAPLVDVDLVDEAPELTPADEFDPAEADWVEAMQAADEAAAMRLLDRSKTLSLPELIDHQADWFRSWPSAAGDLIARALDELALKVRMVDATTPEDAMARIEILEQDVRQQWEAIGFENGKAAGLRQAAPYNGPLD
jgi:hypothetical protein